MVACAIVVGVGTLILRAFAHLHRHPTMTLLGEPSALGVVILLGAIGALGLAVFRVLAARGYATHTHAWSAGRLRSDGLVESESGAAMGRLASHIRMLRSDVIVSPAQTKNRAAYREMPLLERRDFRFGSHARWTRATFQRLRDARVLAIISTVTTAIAVLANQFAG